MLDLQSCSVRCPSLLQTGLSLCNHPALSRGGAGSELPGRLRWSRTGQRPALCLAETLSRDGAGRQAVQAASPSLRKVNPGSRVPTASWLYQFVLDPTEHVLHNLFPRMKCFTNAAFNHLVKGDEKPSPPLGWEVAQRESRKETACSPHPASGAGEPRRAGGCA